MAKNEKAPKGAKAQKPLYKKWWFWVVAVSLAGGCLYGLAGGGETGEPPTGQVETQPPAQVSPEPSKTPEAAPAETTPEPVETETQPSENPGGGVVADAYSVQLGADYVTITKHPVLSGSGSYIFDIGVCETTSDVMAALSSDEFTAFVKSLDFETYGYNNIVLSFEDGTGINFMKGSSTFTADYGYMDVGPGNFTMTETLGSIWDEGEGWYYMTVAEMEAEDAAG